MLSAAPLEQHRVNKSLVYTMKYEIVSKFPEPGNIADKLVHA